MSDEKTGAKWVDIDGSSSLVVGFSTGEGERDQTSDPADKREGEGDSE